MNGRAEKEGISKKRIVYGVWEGWRGDNAGTKKGSIHGV